MSGKLLLLPNLLDESQPHELYLPAGIGAVVKTVNGLIAESEKAARRYLRRFLSHDEMARMPLKTLNEHTQEKELDDFLAPLLHGETWGLISDAGLPCVADPGAPLVWRARLNNIPVETFAGPSSILMALQLSGFCGQRFSFHGYLPREGAELELKIRELERRSRNETEIWIEAPYRSQKMLEFLKQILSPNTKLCVAASLTLPTQKVVSQTVSKWKHIPLVLEKEPAVFLLDSHP